jgi:23S rRNA (guanosine2251-2'-O)-methyltransferase
MGRHMQLYIYGFHSIEETLNKSAAGSVLLLSKEKGRIRHLADLARQKNVPIRMVSDHMLDQFAAADKHRGVLLCVEKKSESTEGPESIKEFLESIGSATPLVLVLDSITDPHNYGAILRSADQFGTELVITPERRSARDSETVTSTSSGANAYVPQLVIPNLVQALELLKENGFWVYGADMDGTRIDKADLKGKVALVLGSEGKGLHRLVKEKCDILVSIPTIGNVDSFNVSVAGGIIMYEIRRQQGFFDKAGKEPIDG